MMKIKSSLSAAVLILAFACSPVAFAQAVSATLIGTVTDSSGATVPNATVTVTETQTGVSRKTNTTSDGVYTVPYLAPGVYRVELENPGFKKFSRDNVGLAVSSTVRIDATLEPGALTETVDVKAES